MKIDIENYYTDKISDRPSLNAGTAITMLNKTPAHAWTEHPRLNPNYQSKNARHFDIGKAFHTSVLGAGDPFVVLDYPDYRTKAAQEEKKQAYQDGKTPILIHEYDPISRMTAAAHKAIYKAGYDKTWERGLSEQGFLNNVDGCPCRCLADRITTVKENVIFDLKSTAGMAKPGAWIRDAMKFGIDVRVAHYLDVVAAETGQDNFDYIFIVVEKKEPYAAAVFRLSDRLIALGKSKIAIAREQWLKYLDEDEWPAWPGHVQTAEAAEWHYHDWMYLLELGGRSVPAELEGDIVV